MIENTRKLKLVATDLDGTFLKNDKTISKENLYALNKLGEKGVKRVIATGRNLKKTMEVISPDIPFDYIVFSSGAGIYDWKHRELLFRQNMGGKLVQQVSDFLIVRNLNFHLFKPVPENYNCWYYKGSKGCDEFERYSEFYRSQSEPLPLNDQFNSEACQFLVVFPDDINLFIDLKREIENQFQEVKVVRTSSPLDTGYIWMEIFHHSVSKGNGVKFVCDILKIDHEYTMGIGNDFNDLDLLEFTNYSYIVNNGPQELKNRFLVTLSNEENAFAMAVDKCLSAE